MSTVPAAPASIRDLAAEALAARRIDEERKLRQAEECRRQRRESAYREIERAVERLTGRHHPSIRASRGDHPDNPGNQIIILAELPHLSWSLKRHTYYDRLLLFVRYRDAQGAERCAWVESLADLGQVLAEAPGSQPDQSNPNDQTKQSKRSR